MNRYSTLHTFFLLFCIVTFLNAQTVRHKLSGIVTEKNSGKVLIGANLFLTKDTVQQKPLFGAVTNKYGFYIFPSVPKDNYFIIVKSIGYETYIGEVKFDEKIKDVKLNIELAETNLFLSEVLVQANKEKVSEAQVSVISLSTDLIKQLPTMTGEVDLFKTLQLIPGVKTQTEISSGIYVRGSSPDQTLTLLDGVIIYNPSHLGNLATTFNTDAIQEIKLIKGAFPAEYGSRLSSVLDISLRDGIKDKYSAKVNLSFINSGLMLEGPLSEKSTFIFSGRKLYYDEFQNITNKNSSFPLYNFFDINGKIKIEIDKSNWITLSGLKSSDYLYNSKNTKDIGYDIKWGNNSINMSYKNIDKNMNFSNTSFNYTNYNFEVSLEDKTSQSTAKDFYTLTELRDYTLKRETEIVPSDEHLIRVGIELTGHSYKLTSGNKKIDEFNQDNSISKEIFSLEAALSLSDDWKILPILTAYFGGRFFYFKEDKLFGFEPRFSIKYMLTDLIALKGAVAYANQFYHLLVRDDIALPTDIWYPSGGRIKPSNSWQFVLGTETQLFDNEYFISLEGYYKILNNLLEYNSTMNVNNTENFEQQLEIGKGEAYGFEIFLNKNFGNLTGWLGYSLSWTKRLFDNINNGKVFFPRYDRRHDISLVLNYKLTNKIGLSLTWTYGSGQAYTLPNGQYLFDNFGSSTSNQIKISYTDKNSNRLPAYHKLDIVANYQFLLYDKTCTIFAGLFNAYNQQNPFAQYITLDETSGKKELKLKQLVLFPIIPTIGISYKF